MPNDDELKKAVAAATKKLNEQIEEMAGELRASQKQAEAYRVELETVRPLQKDLEHALAWASAHPDFKVGGKFHRGFLGTVAPVLKRLGTKVQATSLAGSEAGTAAAGGVAAGGTGVGAGGGVGAAAGKAEGTAGAVGGGGGVGSGTATSVAGDGANEVDEG